jgi:hypothetical protein
MHEYDVVLKLLIAASADTTLQLLGAHGRVKEWLNIELPRIQNHRVDLLASMTSGELIQVELQSANHAKMAQRMAEYAVGIWRREGIYPKQIVLYVGNEEMRMQNRVEHDGMIFWYTLIDFRDLDGAALLASDCISDNILALLARIDDPPGAMHRIFHNIRSLEPGDRADTLRRLLIVSGMRGLEEVYEEEERRMPVTMDIMDHKILGPRIREAVAKEVAELAPKQAEKLAQKLAQKQAEELAPKLAEKLAEKEIREIARFQLEQRFGSLPAWVDERLKSFSHQRTRQLLGEVISAKTLDELFA